MFFSGRMTHFFLLSARPLDVHSAEKNAILSTDYRTKDNTISQKLCQSSDVNISNLNGAKRLKCDRIFINILTCFWATLYIQYSTTNSTVFCFYVTHVDWVKMSERIKQVLATKATLIGQ